MPNIVNEALMEEIERDVREMGSCLIVSFDKLTVAQVQDLRNQFREVGVKYRVIKNRLARKAFGAMDLDMSEAFVGKCGIVTAPGEGALTAARIIREAHRKLKNKPAIVTGGVIEGETITGPAAAGIADMPDKDTVRGQLVGALAAVPRGLATCLQSAGGGGLARAMQARIDKEGSAD